MGDGDRPYRLKVAGDSGAFDPLKDERRDDASMGGGNMAEDVMLEDDIAGVNGVASWLLRSSAKTDSTSLVDSRWNRRVRLAFRPCELGVRLWRWGILVFFPTACASKMPLFVDIR